VLAIFVYTDYLLTPPYSSTILLIFLSKFFISTRALGHFCTDAQDITLNIPDHIPNVLERPNNDITLPG